MSIRLTSPDEGIDETFHTELVTLGRGSGNMLRVNRQRVSGIHGQIVRLDDEWVYQDLGSTNGSLVELDGTEHVLDGRTAKQATLADGARLILGDRQDPVVFHVHIHADDERPTDRDDASDVPRPTIVASRAIGDVATVRSQLFDTSDEPGAIHALFELTDDLQSQLEPAVIAAKLSDFVFANVPLASIAGVFFEAESGFVPLLLRTRSSTEPLAIPWRRVQPLLSDAIENREATLVEDERTVAQRFEQAAPSLKAAIAAPLLDGERVRGLLVVAGPDRFSSRDLDLVSVLAHSAALALRNAKLLDELETLKGKLENENTFLRKKLDEAGESKVEIIGDSQELARVLRQVEIVARTDTTVLVTGETGTGKELVARLVHEASPRAQRLFAAVNCGALNDTLLESELFGHVKGAFTGATRDKQGVFEVADGGTLFLDEFGDVSPRLQVKLLRVLENGDVTPVGSVKTRRVDVRIVAATNKDLKTEVAEGRFREDLYYRINVFPVHLPPLRERRGDVRLLVEHFRARFAAKFDKDISEVQPDALDRLERYAWPGNVRELQNEIERAVLLADDGEPLGTEDLSERIGGLVELPVKIGPLHDTMGQLESQYVRRALKQHDYNRTHTAKTLGISRQALTAKLHKYGLIDLK